MGIPVSSAVKMGRLASLVQQIINLSSGNALYHTSGEGVNQMSVNRSVFHFVLEFVLFFFGLGSFIFPSTIPFNWWIIPVFSLLLLLLEQRNSPRTNLEIAFIAGFFLMFFDFAFENVGTLLFGYWGTSASSFSILAVPIEVMLACFFGGAAWALYVMSAHALFVLKFQNRFNGPLRIYLIVLDLFFFGVGGAAAEWSLIQRGFMYYANGWTSIHALVAYFATWLILHILLETLMRRKSKIRFSGSVTANTH